jgi:oligopeptide transport system permease protein
VDDSTAEAQAVGAAGGPLPGEPSGPQAGLWADAWRELRRDPLFLVSGAVLLLFVVMAASPRLFTRADPYDCRLERSAQPPSADHWFGFDIQGCDYYARVVYGARVSITVGILVTVSAVAVSLVLGSLAGYFGGLVDTLVARLTDIVFGIPLALGAIVLLTVLPDRGLAGVTLVLVLFGWPTMTRLMRSAVLAVRDVDYVRAAKALGASDRRILVRHVLPNALAPVVVYATIYVGIVIATEATLSFLGVGLQLPAISWGLMISDAQFRIGQTPHLLLFPGLFLSLTVLSSILMGDALRDALDPRLR